MVQFWDSIPDHLKDWVRTLMTGSCPYFSLHKLTVQQALAQQVFFTASAPLSGKYVNISPKGLPSSTFSIFDANHAAYIDATGSGSETISHVYENGRVTIMFCSFATLPRIMRFFCMGKVVEWDAPEFEPLLKKMGKTRIDGARAVILLDIFKVCRCRLTGCCCYSLLRKVQTSCGFGVPFLTAESETKDSTSPKELEIEPVLKDREMMGHWASRKIETNTLLEYQAQNNSSSLDGCPGMRSAMREHGERVWLKLGIAAMRRVFAQQWALTIGFLFGLLQAIIMSAYLGQEALKVGFLVGVFIAIFKVVSKVY